MTVGVDIPPLVGHRAPFGSNVSANQRDRGHAQPQQGRSVFLPGSQAASCPAFSGREYGAELIGDSLPTHGLDHETARGRTHAVCHRHIGDQSRSIRSTHRSGSGLMTAKCTSSAPRCRSPRPASAPRVAPSPWLRGPCSGRRARSSAARPRCRRLSGTVARRAPRPRSRAMVTVASFQRSRSALGRRHGTARARNGEVPA